MTTHVISHRTPRRKRGRRSFLLRRFGVLVVTTCALAAASWLAPYFYRPLSPPPAVETAHAPDLPPKLPPPADVTKTVNLATAPSPVAEAPRARRARRGVPLNANAGIAPEDFEILSAGELDAISQAD